MLRGLYPWWHWLLERENPRTLRGKTCTDNKTGANLETRHFKNSRKMLSLQQGGYMTLAQFAMTFWDDLAAPILAGIITAAIVGWWRNRK